MDFRITGIDPAPFEKFFGLSDQELAEQGIQRHPVRSDVGYPDRVEMREGRTGENMLLLNYVSMPEHTPYRASHAIYVREGAQERFDAINTIPEVFQSRFLSLRGFDNAGHINHAEVCPGEELEDAIDRFLTRDDVDYIHVHYAARGCFGGRIEAA